MSPWCCAARPDRLSCAKSSRSPGSGSTRESIDFRSAPTYYAIASSRPLGKIVDAKTAAIYELGLDQLQLSPSGEIDAEGTAPVSAVVWSI